MTVAEMVEYLKTLDQSAEVCVEVPWDGNGPSTLAPIPKQYVFQTDTTSFRHVCQSVKGKGIVLFCWDFDPKDDC
jgi:hypothetical protein